MSVLNITNEDNMQLMARYPDKYFDLAIVDPPYGIKASSMKMGSGKKKWASGKNWDNSIPDQSYFNELFRVSKNQIIWGGNYFTKEIPVSRCWLSWLKGTPEGMSFADFELAWTSFDQVAREVKCKYSGAVQNGKYNDKIHPTQKPIELYKWLLDKYGNGGGKILDTHLGSGSIAIACHDYGFDLTACELDPDYYAAAMKRIKQHTSQSSLFDKAV